MRVLRIIGKGAVAFYDELFFYMVVGLINLVCWIFIIPGPFAIAGIYAISQQAVRSKGVNWALIWDGVKEYGLRSLALFLILIAVYAVVGANVWFYLDPNVSPFPPGVALWTTPVFLLAGLIWTGVTFYAQALLMELQEPKMGLVLRNGLFLTLLQPFQTLGLLIVSLLSLILSIALPLLLIVWPGFISCLAVTAARELITDLRERAETMGIGQEGDEQEQEVEADDGDTQ